ncbi:MAG: hypothetical protein QNJ41_20335 [Xenococcaceae cyanobacterium MO_188.B32]|nr:hypothetical protein [Xenococcaceae cyanobacterium MO_188.B32]
MNSSDNQDWQRKLEELEKEVNQNDSSTVQTETETVYPKVEIDNMNSSSGWLNSARDWFNSLAPIGQVAVGVIAIMLGFSVLNIFLKVISSLISVAILGGLVYLGYKYIFAESSKN